MIPPPTYTRQLKRQVSHDPPCPTYTRQLEVLGPLESHDPPSNLFPTGRNLLVRMARNRMIYFFKKQKAVLSHPHQYVQLVGYIGRGDHGILEALALDLLGIGGMGDHGTLESLGA